jgi:phage-related protein
MSTAFTYTPSYSSAVEQTPRVLKAQFGDGYAQRTADGINNAPEAWNLSFNDMANATIDAIVAVLKTAGGVNQLAWTPPTGVAGLYICEKWNRTYSGGATSSLTAAFTQDFAP